MSAISRRQFFRMGPAASLRQGMREAEPLLRPPGAVADPEAFRAGCERCGACAEACSFDVIFKAGPESGLDEGTPFLKLEEAPCRWCADMPCIAACPSGALQLPAAPLAKAELDLAACLTAQGILCDDCVTACPGSIRAIRIIDRKPVLDEERCVGCGLCVWHCAAQPAAIRLVRSSDV